MRRLVQLPRVGGSVSSVLRREIHARMTPCTSRPQEESFISRCISFVGVGCARSLVLVIHEKKPSHAVLSDGQWEEGSPTLLKVSVDHWVMKQIEDACRHWHHYCAGAVIS